MVWRGLEVSHARFRGACVSYASSEENLKSPRLLLLWFKKATRMKKDRLCAGERALRGGGLTMFSENVKVRDPGEVEVYFQFVP